jgi:hypothetical protein
LEEGAAEMMAMAAAARGNPDERPEDIIRRLKVKMRTEAAADAKNKPMVVAAKAAHA